MKRVLLVFAIGAAAALTALGAGGTAPTYRVDAVFDSTVKTVEDVLPVVHEVRPYVPDLIGGLMNGFGGTTAGYYDANGHYVRISFQGSTATLTGLGTLLPRPPEDQGLTGFRTNVDKRCPGAATQAAGDGSAPYIEDPEVCDEEDTPR